MKKTIALIMARRLFALVMSLAALPCFSATVAWTNAASGNWGNPINWSPNQVPGPGDTAVISSNSITVTLDNNYEVNGIILGANLNCGAGGPRLSVNGHTLYLDGTFTVNACGQFALDGGVLVGNGPNAVLAGTMSWTGGQLSGTLTLAANSVLNIAGSGNIDLPSCTLTNLGTVAWSSGTIRGGGNGSAIYNYGLWDAQSDQTINCDYAYNPVTFYNLGTFRKSAGSTTNSTVFLNNGSGVVINNTGVLDVRAGTLSFLAGGSFTGGTATNTAGIIQLASGNFTVNGTVTSTNFQQNGGSLAGNNILAGAFTWVNGTWSGAAVTVTANSLLVIAGGGGFNDLPSCIVTNLGTVAWRSGTLRGGYNGSSIYNYGVWDAQSDQTINCDYAYNPVNFYNLGIFRKSGGSLTNSTVFLNNSAGVIINNTGVLDVRTGALSFLAGGSFTGGTATNTAGIIQLTSGNYTVNGTVTSTNFQQTGGNLVGNNVLAGGFTWFSGTWNSAGVTLATNSLLVIAGGGGNNDLPSCTFTNLGSVAWSSGTIRGGYNGSFIYNYGVWDAQSDQTLSAAYGYNPVNFYNLGIFRKSAGSSTNSTVFFNDGAGVVINNTGVLDVRAGTLSFLAGGNFTGGTATNTAGVIQLALGNFTVNGTITSTNFQQTGGNLAGNNVLAGAYTWIGGTWNNATVTVATNSLVVIAGGSGLNDLASSTLTNLGTVAWSSGTIRGGYNGSFIYNYGLWDAQGDLTLSAAFGYNPVLFNNSGTFRKSAGSPTNSTMFLNDGAGVVINNTGVLDVRAGTLSFLAGGSFTGGTATNTAGFIQLATGTFTVNGTVTGVTVRQTGGNLAGNNVLKGGFTWISGLWSSGCSVTVATNSLLAIAGGSGNNDLPNCTVTNLGTVAWSSGTLRSGGGGACSIYNYGVWDAQGDLTFNDDYAYSPLTFNNLGTFRKSAGTGSVLFQNNNSGVVLNSTGNVNVLSGTLALTQAGSLTGGTLNFGVSGSTNFGRINAASATTLGGGVSVVLLNGYLPPVGTPFTVLTFPSETGTFTDYSGLNAGSGIAFSPALSATNLVLTAAATNFTAVPPKVVSQPVSQTVNYGDTATLQVGASGSPQLLFQWKLNNAPLANATNATLVLTNVQFAQAGAYTVFITNSAGGVLSQAAQLSVAPVLPSFTLQPVSVTVPQGSNVSFTVAVKAAPAAVLQWQFNGNNLVNGGRISGAQALTLNITNVQPGDAGNYSAIASNAYGQAVSSTAVLRVGFPDLAITNITAPANAVLGQTIPLVFTITNLGNGIAEGPWQNQILLGSSTNGVGAQSLGNASFAGNLAGNSSIVVTQTVLLPANLFGSLYFGVVADSGNNVVELSKANNTNFASTPILIQGADLTLAQPGVPAAAQYGQAFNVTFAVTNIGTAPANVTWNDQIYFNTVSNSLAGATWLASLPGTSPLAVNASYARTQSVTLPLTANSAAGAFYIFVLANGDNGQPELTRTNNLLSAPITLSLPPLPDLVVGQGSSPTSAVAGQSISFSWAVTNLGSGTATAPWQESVYLVPASLTLAQFTTNITAYPLLGAFTYTNSLAPGASVTRTQQITIPLTGLAGDLRAAIWVNSDNAVLEQNKTNNTALATNDLQVPLTLSLDVPTTNVLENTSSPNLGCLISRNGSLASPLTVSLASSATNHLQVPPSVTIPAGQASAPFTTVVLDDGIPDPDALVTISATAGSYQTATSQILVVNTDIPRLTLSLSAPQVNQGQTVAATITSSFISNQPVVVSIASSSAGALTFPTTMTIPANSNSVSFLLLAVQNTLITPSQLYTVSASASGYASGVTNLTVYNNNTPTIYLSLSRTNINEDDGSYAVVATVTRQPITDQSVTIALASTNTGAARVPAQITIPGLQATAVFNIAAVNDPNVTGPKTTLISAQALDTTGNAIGSAATQTLLVQDVNGPLLKVTLANPIVPKGTNPATIGTVSATVPPTNALVVTLASSATNEATVPATVTLPAGQTNATFVIASQNDGITLTSQSAIISAQATNYASGSALLTVTDLGLPDLLITRITAPGAAFAAEPLTIGFRLANQGLGALNTAVSQNVYLTTDPVGGNYLLMGTVSFPGPLAAGQYVDESLIVPGNMLPGPGLYYIEVVADANNYATELNKANNALFSTAPILISPEYTATVTPGVTNVIAGTPVPLSGSATLIVGGPAANKPVNILLNVRGLQRVISATTDGNGYFSTVFTPLPTEAGSYTVAAVAPGITSAPAQGQFNILGFSTTPASLALTVTAGTNLTGSVSLQNLGEVPLTGLTATVNGLAANIAATVTLNTNFLAGQGSVSLAYNITANDSSIRQSSFTIHLTSAEGVALDLPVSVTVNALLPRLAASPLQLTASMLRGSQTVLQFGLVNQGGAPSGPLSVVLPNVPWLGIASTNPLPSVAPGATNQVTLILSPTASMALGPYTGTLEVNGGGIALQVPFTFTAVSDAHGALNVQSVDEYTYFATGAPPLTNASVTVINPFTQAVVASGVTGTNGQLLISNLMEGSYELDLSAPQHAPFRGSAVVTAGQTNSILTFLSRQTVTYVWTVVPTSLQDTNTIVIQAEFEANVPAPVIVPTPATIDLAPLTQPGQVLDIPFTLVNQGLIAVHNVALNIGTHPLYRFDVLTENVGDLPAHGTVTIPIRITRLAGPAKTPSAQNVPPPGAPCNIQFGLKYSYPCGPFGIEEDVQITVQHVSGDCTPHPVSTSINVGCINCGSISGGGNGGYGGPGGSGSGPSVSVPPQFSLPAQCDPCYANALRDCLIGFTPIGCAYGAFNCGYGLGSGGINALSVENCISQGVGCLGPVGNLASCLQSLIRCKCPQNNGCITGLLGGGGSSGGAPLSRSPDATAGDGLSSNDLRDVYAARSYVVVELMGMMIGDTDGRWFSPGSGGAFSVWFSAFSQAIQTNSPSGTFISTAETTNLLALPVPNTVSPADVQNAINRWNLSISNWNAQVYSPTNVAPGGNTNFIDLYALTNLLGTVSQQYQVSQAAGYDSPIAGFIAAVTASGSHAGSTCARVVIEIDQNAVLTRDAFHATLQLNNNSPNPMMNVSVNLTVQNQAGQDVTSLFGIEAPTVSGGLTGVTGAGSLSGNATGSAQWTLIPSLDAAPQAITNYLVSGTFSYVQNGATVTIPLAPAPITVQPSPQLYLKYFLQRDVYADDPFTPEIEPSIPFPLAVMVLNKGFGPAQNFQITSAQPKIVDNKKGLLINFEIIGTQVAGQAVTPSLTANFGTIPPGSNTIGEWLFTSSLQGLFIDYKASFKHVDPLGNPRLSLIQGVEIHEMTHIVQAPGAWDDGRPDFLVDAMPNYLSLPDTLYLSDGTTQPVSVLQTASTDAPASTNHLQVQFTANFPAGFTYVVVPDPANGQFPLLGIQRANGTNLLTPNYYITDRTFIGLGQEPIREHNLHLFDYHTNAGPDTYTLVYGSPTNAPQTNAPLSSVYALPALSPSTFGVAWNGAPFVGQAPLAYYDIYVADNGGAFTNWQSHTLATSGIFTGALGHNYSFYSISTDTIGNREATPLQPQAHTTVNPTNYAPTISITPSVAINAGQTLSLGVTAGDSNLFANLTFSLAPGAPAGAAVDPASGQLSWATSLAQGGTTNPITVIVTDDSQPPLSATGTVQVIVQQVTVPPVLAAIPNYTILDGQLLTFTNSATDNNVPPRPLVYSLGAGAPVKATINSSNGVFQWRPTASQAPSTNFISVVVTDNATPPLSATQQFTVFVRKSAFEFLLGAGSTNVLAGNSGSVPLTLDTTLPLTNLTLVLQGPASGLTNFTLQAVSPEVVSTLLQPIASNRYSLNFALNPAASPGTLRTLGQLGFLAPAQPHSAVIPLVLSQLSATQSDGTAAAKPVASSGRVFLIAQEPLLDAWIGSNSSRNFALYGIPQASYELDSSTNFITGNWRFVRRVPLTNSYSVFSANSSLPQVYYRAFQFSADPPILELNSFSPGNFGLLLYGRAGSNYTILTGTNAANTSNWTSLTGFSLTNSFQFINAGGATNSAQYFKAQRH